MSSYGFRALRWLAAQRQLRAVRALGLRSPHYVDLGASGGMPYVWRRAIDAGLVDATLIDPSPEWEASKAPKRARRILEAVGAEDGPATLYVTRHPGCASCLKPIEGAASGYENAEWFMVNHQEPVELKTYARIADEHRLPDPVWIKSDIQGLDLGAIESFGTRLQSVLCIELEARLRPFYEGEPDFFEIRRRLEGLGFRLRWIAPQMAFGTEVVEVNAFFYRPTDDPRLKAWEILNSLPPQDDLSREHLRLA